MSIARPPRTPPRAAPADAPRTHAMGDVAPCATIYVNNLNEKIKKDGAFASRSRVAANPRRARDPARANLSSRRSSPTPPRDRDPRSRLEIRGTTRRPPRRPRCPAPPRRHPSPPSIPSRALAPSLPPPRSDPPSRPSSNHLYDHFLLSARASQIARRGVFSVRQDHRRRRGEDVQAPRPGVGGVRFRPRGDGGDARDERLSVLRQAHARELRED